LVQNLKTGKLVKSHLVRGHPTVNLTTEKGQIKVVVHSLVGDAFVPGKKDDWVIGYRDHNNFNLYAGNLFWKPRYNRSWIEGEEPDDIYLRYEREA